MIVDQFLQWMANAPLEGRCRAASALARSFLVSDLDDVDREALEATLTVLLDDPEPDIRRTIADVLADSDKVPHHLILTLAEGQPDIAAMVLERTPVLLEAELVDIIALGDAVTQGAIATRRWLPPTLAAALAEVAELPACLRLVRNLTASIPVFSLEKLVERFGYDGELRNAMLALPHLPITVRQSLLMLLSDALSGLATDRSWMEGHRADAMSLESKDRTTVQLAAAAGDDELPRLVEHLRATGQLTTTLLLRAVTLGDIRFLVEALTVLSQVPRGRVSALLVDGREPACRAILLKAGLPARTVPAFLAALDVQRALSREVGLQGVHGVDEHRFAQRVVERVLTEARAADPGAMDDLIVLLRRFATDAARDAARQYVNRIKRRPPLALPAPAPAEATDAELIGDAAAAQDFDLALEQEFELALADDLVLPGPPHLAEPVCDGTIEEAEYEEVYDLVPHRHAEAA